MCNVPELPAVMSWQPGEGACNHLHPGSSTNAHLLILPACLFCLVSWDSPHCKLTMHTYWHAQHFERWPHKAAGPTTPDCQPKMGCLCAQRPQQSSQPVVRRTKCGASPQQPKCAHSCCRGDCMSHAAPAQGAGHSHIHRHKHEEGCPQRTSASQQLADSACA